MPRVSSRTQSLNQLVDTRASEPSSRQKRRQPPFAHRRGQAGQLPCPLLGEGAHCARRIDAVGGERRAHRLLRHVAVHALGEQVLHEPRLPATPSALRSRVVRREAGVVEEVERGEPVERAVHGGGRVLLLQQAAAQVDARVRAPRQRAQRGAVRGLEIGQLLQPLEYAGANLLPNDEGESYERIGRERRKTPPIHFDQPIVRPARIGGESGEGHSSLAAISSSPPSPPPPPPRRWSPSRRGALSRAPRPRPRCPGGPSGTAWRSRAPARCAPCRRSTTRPTSR